jgi:hypothetical protein
MAIVLACLLQCSVGLCPGLPGHIEKVEDSTWLINSGEDLLVAHAVLTLPPYNADPHGQKDSTRAFKKAIAAVSKMGGGLIYVPAGLYKVQGTIQLNRDKIVIQGEAPQDAAARSTMLLAYHGEGDETAHSFITIGRSSCGLKDISIFYPKQGKDKFIPYPYTIKSHPSVLLENLTLYNSYKGIRFDWANAILLENIRMCALKEGITAKWSSEFGWARNIEISAKVSQELPAFVKATKPDVAAVRSFMRENCTGMELGALDGVVLDGLEAADCKTALWVTKDPEFIKTHHNGREDRRLRDNFGFGAILSRIRGRIAYNGHDYYYWGMPPINLDNVRGLPELRQKWPSHRRAAKTSSADFFQVKDFGATGDGNTDDTAAVLKALKKAASNGGGIVYFPQGSYRITEPLTVPSGTELRGACARQEVRLGYTEVTSLLFEMEAAGEDVAMAPASITLTENAGIRGLNILFPKQWSSLTEDGFKPVPQPYAVRGRGKGVYLIDCVITPAWQMVDFASHRCDDFMIKRVAGWGMKNGINIGGGTRGGTIEFTQITFGLTEGTARNAVLKTEDGWNKSVAILGDYSGKNSVSYLFGDASGIDCYGLQAFHPLKHIVMYKQKNAGKNLGLRDSRFHYPLLDVSLEQSLDMNGARDIDFYGYWVTGRHRKFNWVKATDIEKIRVFAPVVLPSYHRGNYELSVPLDEFEMIPETTLRPDTKIVTGDPGVKHVLDGNLKTYWKAPLSKASFVLDLGKVMTVHRYTLVDGHMFDFKDTTSIKRYRISVSLNNTDWTPLKIPKTTFMEIQYKNPSKYVVLDQPVVPTKARFAKLEILDVWDPTPAKGTADSRSAIVRMFNIWAEPNGAVTGNP